MGNWSDRLNRAAGKSRYVVCRIFVHVSGPTIAPLLGTLNRVGRDAITAEGDPQVMGEGLVEVCQSLLQLQLDWQAAANEGDVFWDEGEAGDYVTELFTDTAQRYLAQPDVQPSSREEDWAIAVTRHIVVIMTVALRGEVPALETDLAEITTLEAGLKALINWHYQDQYQAIQIHFSPAQLGDELTQEQVLVNFPELIPL